MTALERTRQERGTKPSVHSHLNDKNYPRNQVHRSAHQLFRPSLKSLTGQLYQPRQRGQCHSRFTSYTAAHNVSAGDMGAMAGSGANDNGGGHESIVELAEIVTSDASAAVTTCGVGGRGQSPAKMLLAIRLSVFRKSNNKTLDCSVPVYRGSWP